MHYDKLQQSSILRKLYSFDFPLLAFVDELSADFVAVLKSNTGYSQLPNMDSLRNAKLLAHPLWGFNFSGRADKCFFLQIPPKRYLSFQAKIALICPPIPFPHSAEANMLRHLRRKLNSPAKYLLNPWCADTSTDLPTTLQKLNWGKWKFNTIYSEAELKNSEMWKCWFQMYFHPMEHVNFAFESDA